MRKGALETAEEDHELAKKREQEMLKKLVPEIRDMFMPITYQMTYQNIDVLRKRNTLGLYYHSYCCYHCHFDYHRCN